MHYWDGAGVRLAADSWGDPNGPLIILQHGGGQTRHAWRGTGETLGLSGYHAVAFDARGHGDSEWAADGNYDRSAMVDDLIRVVEHLAPAAPPVLVGASMGGNTSLAALGEGRLEGGGLVLVDIAPRIRPEGTKKIGEFMGQKPDGFDSLEEVAEAIANYQPHRKRPRNLDGLAKNIRLAPDGKYRWHWDPRFRRRSITPEEMRARTRHMEDCSRNLTVPTLLVRGGLSDVLDEAGAQAFLALVPHAEYVNVTDAAHMVAGDRNDIFATAVIDFLTRIVPVK